MTTTKYSDKIEGDRGNFNWAARFDITGGYLGITQMEDGAIKDRVLLTPKQVKELVTFVEAHGRKRARAA